MTGYALAKNMLSVFKLTATIRLGKKRQNEFDYRQNQITLSPAVARGTNGRSLYIAAHEAGHAIQATNTVKIAIELLHLITAVAIGIIVAFVCMLIFSTDLTEEGALLVVTTISFAIWGLVPYLLLEILLEIDATIRAKKYLQVINTWNNKARNTMLIGIANMILAQSSKILFCIYMSLLIYRLATTGV